MGGNLYLTLWEHVIKKIEIIIIYIILLKVIIFIKGAMYIWSHIQNVQRMPLMCNDGPKLNGYKNIYFSRF